MEEEHDGESVTRNPRIMGGQPCLAGTRLPVYSVLEYVFDCLSENAEMLSEITEEFDISEDQLLSVLRWVVELTAER